MGRGMVGLVLDLVRLIVVAARSIATLSHQNALHFNEDVRRRGGRRVSGKAEKCATRAASLPALS